MTSESARGHSVVVAFLGPGYIVGMAGLSTPPVYTFNAIAADGVTAYGWTRAQTDELITRSAFRHYLDQVTYHYTELLATRLHSLSDGPVAERLAAALLELAVMHGVPAGHGGLIEIAPSVSLEDLGGLAGTTTESVTRFVTQWRDAGAVLPPIGKRRVSLYPERAPGGGLADPRAAARGGDRTIGAYLAHGRSPHATRTSRADDL